MTDDASTDGPLSPDELDPNDDRLRRIDDRRYVISTDSETDSGGETSESTPQMTDGDPDTGAQRSTELRKPERVGPAELDGAYALDIRARIDGRPAGECRIDTNDVSVAFESLLRWYADQVAEDTPQEEVLAVLLGNTGIQFSAGDDDIGTS